MIGLSVVFGIVVILLCWCYWRQTCSRTAKLLNAFPSAGFYLPVIGDVWKLSKKQDDLFKQIRQILASYNETISGWGGPYAVLHIVTAEDAEIILTNVKHIEKGILYAVLERWLNKGLLTSTGKKWHQRRKMLTRSFHLNILQMFIEVFGEQCDSLTKILKEECAKPKTNIIPIITMTTLSTICETAMGVKLDQNKKNLTGYYDSLHHMAEIFIQKVLSPWLYIDMIYNITPLSWHEAKLVKYLHKFTTDIIQSREKTFKIQDVIDLESTDTKAKKRSAMLDLLLYAKHLGEIDDEGIKEEVDTFVFGGHDTTSSGICFALLLLANHKDVQEKIISELNAIFGDSKRHATCDDLQNMKYLECCLKESLRLYPSVPFIIRNIKEDVPLTKHVAPAGTEVWIHIYNIHRDPKYFPDPEKFDPDRFLPENSKGRHPYCYIPFSAGPRNCIGQKFAMLELKSIVSSILRNFTMEPIDTREDLTFLADIILRVNGPLNIKFKSRGDNY